MPNRYRKLPARKRILTALTTIALTAGSFVAVDLATATVATAATIAAPTRALSQAAPQAMPPASVLAPARAAVAAPLPGPVVTAVSGTINDMDIFGVDVAQRIWTSSWEAGEVDGWHRSVMLNGGIAAAGTAAHAVRRANGRLDVFVVGTDQRVWTAYKEPTIDKAWQGWWKVGDFKVRANSSVHAIAPNNDRIDLFAVGEDRIVHTIRWTTAQGWGTWTAIPGALAGIGSMVYAVRVGQQTHIFGVNTAFQVITNVDSGSGFADWRVIDGGVPVDKRSSVYPVKYGLNKITFFATGESSGDILNGTYDPVTGQYSNLVRLKNGRAMDGSTVFAAGTSTTRAITVGTNGHPYAIEWRPSTGWGDWEEIGGPVGEGSSVFVHVRGAGDVNYFAVSPNTGTYTRTWLPGVGYGDWHEVGPFGQGQGLEIYANVDFDNGVTVKGWTRVRVSSNGAWNFSGHYHNSGVFTYTVGFAALVGVPSGTGFIFYRTGTVDGVLGDDHDLDFNESGVNPQIASRWAEIVAAGDLLWHATSSLDVPELLDQILLGGIYILKAVVVVSG